MKFRIKTKEPEKLREAFQKMETEIATKTQGSGVVSSSYEDLGNNEFILDLSYLFSNPLTNIIISRELKNTLKKIDPKVQIDKV